MTGIRAVIVDDERLARSELRSMLEAHDVVTVVGEANDVPSAVSLIERAAPDVVFLDIQMPGKSGFELLNEIDVACEVVFTTAFDEYAVRAFDVNAFDYLVKPIHPDRLALAIARLTSGAAAPKRASRRLDYTDTLLVRSGGRLRSVKVCDIVLVRAEGDYTEVLTAGGTTELVHKAMKEWERRLPANEFRRIHRATIVNLRYLERVDESPRHHVRVYMKHADEPLKMSRRYASALKREMT